MNKIYGVVIGTVTDLKDPKNLGRVKVQFPWLSGKSKLSGENSIQETETDTKKNESYWARIATTMTGANRGTWFMPEIDDEVLVSFEHGDPDHPYIIGFLWNGEDRPPSKQVRDRMIRSKNGHMIRFLDSTPNDGNLGGLIIEDGHGNRIVMANGKIKIKSTLVLEIEASTISLQGPGYKRIVSPNNNPI